MDKTALLKRRASDSRQDVDLGGGLVVTVRGLTRGEVVTAQKAGEDGMDGMILCLGMVEPSMTPADVKEWLETAPAGDPQAVMDAIRDLSGLGEGARKSSP